MATETRVLRPYLGATEVQGVLDRLELRFGSERIQPGSTAQTTREAFLRARVELLIPEGFTDDLARGLGAHGNDLDDFALVVIAGSAYLKIADEVHRTALSSVDGLPSTIRLDLSDRQAAFRTAHHGCDVSVQVVRIGEGGSRRPLRPWRLGASLARTVFSVRTEGSWAAFNPVPLTPELRTRLGLPAQTLRYAVIEESPLDPGAELEDVLTFYVDGELLAVLSGASKSPVGQVMQKQLFVDAIGAIVQDAISRDDWDDLVTLDHLESSVLGRLLQLVGRGAKEGDGAQRALDLLQRDVGLFMAFVEAHADVRAEWIEALEA